MNRVCRLVILENQWKICWPRKFDYSRIKNFQETITSVFKDQSLYESSIWQSNDQVIDLNCISHFTDLDRLRFHSLFTCCVSFAWLISTSPLAVVLFVVCVTTVVVFTTSDWFWVDISEVREVTSILSPAKRLWSSSEDVAFLKSGLLLQKKKGKYIECWH